MLKKDRNHKWNGVAGLIKWNDMEIMYAAASQHSVQGDQISFETENVCKISR